MLINELFEPSKSYKLNWVDDDAPSEVVAQAHDARGRLIEIRFQALFSPKVVDIDFEVAGRFDVTGEGDQYRIFATVVDAIRQYIQDYQAPNFFIFMGKGESRSALYRRMVQRMAGSLGYQMSTWQALPDAITKQFPPNWNSSGAFILRRNATVLDEVNIDNREGAGAVPYNADVDYFGLRVQMRPSTFLKLAAPLGGAHDEKLEQYIAQGGAIGAPFLMVDIPEQWENGDFDQWAEVTGHEGRNRVSAVRKLEGDEPIEMHIFPRYLRRRHLTPQWVEALNRGLIGEGTARRVSGPLFDVANLEEGWREKAAAAMPATTVSEDLRLNAGGDKSQAAKQWIQKVYQKYPLTWQNNHVMRWGEGDDQELAMFELVPNPARPNHVEVKWFQAYPLRRGVGTRAMRELQRLAQEAGIALTLYAWDKGQVSRSKLMKFYRSVGFRPTSAKSASMIWQPDQVDEGWREKTAALATAATLGYGAYNTATKPNVDVPQAARYVAQKAQPQLKASKPFVLTFADKKPIRDYLVQRGRQAGFTDKELAHLVAQVAHETMDFKHLEEIGNSKYFAKKYDKRYNPRKAKILGNIKLGDGERFKGRGFVHLTGRDNYTRAGRALGVDLVNQPQLAADPKIAADIAVWYWKNRVQPDIEDFSKATVAQVTKPINPGLKGLQDREAKFQKIVNK